MARTDPQLNFRIPAELKARLEEAARAAGRSLNSELVARLQASLDAAHDSQHRETFARRFDRMALQIDALHKAMRHQPIGGGIEMIDEALGPVVIEHGKPVRKQAQDQLSPVTQKGRRRS